MSESETLLVTPRLRLRRCRMDDAPLIEALDGDPEVMRFISHGVATPRARIEREILPRWLAAYEANSPRGYWAAELAASHEFIGWFHLRTFREDPQELELGYRLVRRVWGQGLASEGSLSLIEAGFNSGATRIVATTLIDNQASRRVMEKCGLSFRRQFHYEAARLPDWTQDERRGVEYALERADYLKRHQSQTHRAQTD